MKRKATRYFFLLLLIVALSLGGTLFALHLRLKQGPIALNFLTNLVQNHIAQAIDGMRVTMDGVILEWEPQASYPRLRLKNLRLENARGHLLLQAPRAQFSFSPFSLLWGQFKVYYFELIGPQVWIRKKMNGEFEMGFGDLLDANATAQPDLQKPETPVPLANSLSTVALGELKEYLASGQIQTSLAQASLEKLRVKNASFYLYDEANHVVWSSPNSNFSFKRESYGLVTFADATFNTRTIPWRTEIVATYRFDREVFSVSARVFDLMPSEIAQQTFVFSEFAQVKIPLSGQAVLEFSKNGTLLKGSAELTTGAGHLGFPHYISDPIAVDEGLLRFDYNPQTGGVSLNNSELFISGVRTEIKGDFSPVRDASQRLEALSLSIETKHTELRTNPQNTTPLGFNKMIFSGIAFLNDRRLKVNTFALSSPETTLQFSGQFIGGEKAVGIELNGNLANISIPLLKRIWPSVLAPSTRTWISQHIEQGVLSSGVFKINLPPQAMFEALSGKNLPEDGVDFSFEAKNISGTYYKALPPLKDLTLNGHFFGNSFELLMQNGVIKQDGRGEIVLENGKMTAEDVMGEKIPARFILTTRSELSSALSFVNLPDLHLLEGREHSIHTVSGDALITTQIDVPLGKQEEGDLAVEASAQVNKAAFSPKNSSFSFKDGTLALNVNQAGISAEGDIYLSNKKAQLLWKRDFSAVGKDQYITLKGTFEEKDLAKFGVTLSPFIKGKTGVDFSGVFEEETLKKGQVQLDLSQATLAYAPLRWSHQPSGALKASFEVDALKTQGWHIKDFNLSGAGVVLKGDFLLDNHGAIKKGDFSDIKLGKTARFSAKISPNSSSSLEVNLKGDLIDLSSVIPHFFAEQAYSTQKETPSASRKSIMVQASFEKVKIQKGEMLLKTDLTFHTIKDKLASLELKSRFANNSPLFIFLKNDKGGDQTLHVQAGDAGSLLRGLDIYTKMYGGTLELKGKLQESEAIKNLKGIFVIRRFEIKNEKTFSKVDLSGKQKSKKLEKPGTTLRFAKLRMPFMLNQTSVKLGDGLLQGADFGASAKGTIRLRDGDLDITGTFIPIYALNSILGNVPLLGDVLMGGPGQGVFGMNFRLRGSMKNPNFAVNPVSALAPGFLRHLFSAGSSQEDTDLQER